MKVLFVCTVLCFVIINGKEEKSLEQIFEDTNWKLSLKFLNVLSKGESANVISSSFSVLFLLAQLSLAARGNTRTEILEALGLPDNDTVITDSFQGAVSSMESVNQMTVANKIYVSKKVKLNHQFVKHAKNVFQSEIESVNFNDRIGVSTAINRWVEKKTHNLIKNLMNPDSLNILSRIVLVNAIYFKGKWKKAFPKKNTKSKNFYLTKTNQKRVEMMYSNKFFNYGDSAKLDAQLLRLYYEGNDTSMLVILPTSIEGIDELIANLANPELLKTAIRRMYTLNVHVYLPKFKIEKSTDLIDSLNRIGIKQLFIDAQLDNLLQKPEPMKVDKAIQKAYIKTDEQGTEAAAATAFTGRRLLGAPKSIEGDIVFKADHPFVFMILHQDNIIFEGIYRQ